MDAGHEDGRQQGMVFTDQLLYSVEWWFQKLRFSTEFSINIKASSVTIGFGFLLLIGWQSGAGSF